MLPEYFRMLSNPSRIDANRGDHFLEPDLNEAARAADGVKLHQRLAPSSFALLHSSVPQEFSS